MSLRSNIAFIESRLTRRQGCRRRSQEQMRALIKGARDLLRDKNEEDAAIVGLACATMAVGMRILSTDEFVVLSKRFNAPI